VRAVTVTRDSRLVTVTADQRMGLPDAERYAAAALEGPGSGLHAVRGVVEVLAPFDVRPLPNGWLFQIEEEPHPPIKRKKLDT
jgi:hypothetical protein